MKLMSLAFALSLGFLSCKPREFNDSKSKSKTSGPLVERPKQYVMLSFDGSQRIDMWKETRDFAQKFKDHNNNKELHFTYFVNALYYFPPSQRKVLYVPPRNKPGAAAIDFDADDSVVPLRVVQTTSALLEGHEIASHSVGHFDGGKWSELEWQSEFEQFDSFLFGRHPNLPIGSVAGFRAPFLSFNNAMQSIQQKWKMMYDSSRSGNPSAWPKQVNGMWLLNLGDIPRAGGKMIQSMDYNFSVVHKNLKFTPEQARINMRDSYRNYFYRNYWGSRAPISIGHHFSGFGFGTAYLDALKDFAAEVCAFPDVECISHVEMARKLETWQKTQPDLIAAYKNGNFPKLKPAGMALALSLSQDPVEETWNLSPAEREAYGLVGDSLEAHKEYE